MAQNEEPSFVMDSFENGEVYMGMMKKGMKHGYGKILYVNGN